MSGKKIAIVTGASSGMGREMVYLLADHFAALEEIWVIARRKDRLEELVGKVPVSLRILPFDLSDEEDLCMLSGLLKQEQPNVKILVNGAGYGKTGAAGTIPGSLSTGMVRLNDEALVAVTEMVLPYISGNSRIIQFASAAAFMPQPRFAVYAASKSFVLSYSRALAAELKKKEIYVTAVCPGPVETEFFGIALNGGKLAPIKKLTMADPKRVVKKALLDSMKGKRISVYGPWMKAFYVLCRIVPHEILMGFINW